MLYLFALSIFWILYVYLLFPVVTWLLARYRPAPTVNTASNSAARVSVLVCAFNEEESIHSTLTSLAAQTYPQENLEIIIASDGSTDKTHQIVREFVAENVQLLELPRQGKVPTMNAAIRAASGEILVFTDANSQLEQDAVARLVANFADRSVGGVAGAQHYQSLLENRNDGEQTYWNLERLLKQWQSQAGSVTSATGALHALRRTLIEELPSGVTDDFAISTLAVLKGYRLIYNESAIAYEPPATTNSDFARKRRIMTRGLRGVCVRRKLLNPFRYGLYAHQLLVQKVLRRLAFLPLGTALIASLWLAPHSMLFAGLSVVQLCWWVSCIALSHLDGAIPKPMRLMGYFWSVNRAAFSAALDVVRGQKVETWEPRSG